MTTPNLSFLGLADIYLKRYGVASAGAYPIGSVSKCDITHEEEEKTQQNFGRDGGTLNAVSRLTKVGINLTLQSLSKSNLALALRGTASSVAAGAVVDEVVVAKKGALVPLANVGATAVVVKNSAGSTTYVNGTDYTVTGAGIIPAEAGAITEDQSLKVSYSHPGADVVEALTSGTSEFTLYFDGVNEAEGNRNVSVAIWRIKTKLAKTVGLISDDFATLELEGEALLDATQIGALKSKFYRWAYAKAAA